MFQISLQHFSISDKRLVSAYQCLAKVNTFMALFLFLCLTAQRRRVTVKIVTKSGPALTVHFKLENKLEPAYITLPQSVTG